MHEGIERVQGQGVNFQHIEDVRDTDVQALRKLFDESELVHAGDVITKDDYEAIMRRAEVLLQKSAEPLSATAALLAACVDRLQLKEKIGMETLKGMPVDSLKAVFYAEGGVMFTDEEINLFKESALQLDEWMEKRGEIRKVLH